MAGTSTKDIKNRIKSVENTGQITKAMELVATSKLRRAKLKVELTRPFFEILTDTLDDIKSGAKDFSCVYTKGNKSERTCVIVIGGDRGMAGGYNQNVFKTADKIAEENDVIMLPVGKKATEYYLKSGLEILTAKYDENDEVNISDCHSIGKLLSEEFKKETFGRLVIVYTEFVSMLSQEPRIKEILPLKNNNKKDKKLKLTVYEPSAQSVFESIVPQYISGVLHASLCESLASEHAARRTAMESASKNAQEMIDDLTLKFNRARQAAITQEITEIVSGAETL